MTDDEATIARYWQEVWTEGHILEAASEIYAPTYLQNATERTPEGFAAAATAWAAHFSDWRVDVDELFSAPATASCRASRIEASTPATSSAFPLAGARSN